ncbi:MAG: O-methyltransferase [Planctomycetaceae bacterium]
MSVEATLVTEAHFRYLAERTLPEDDFLRDLRAAAAAAGIPAISIGPAQASFFQILLRAARARVVVEVGTLGGLSAIAMARALPEGGRLHTIEIDPRHASFARRWIARSDVADRVELHEGPGAVVLKSFPAHSADAAFLDADKSSYALYLEECIRILRPGGLLLADNAFAFGQLFEAHPTDREAPAIQRFNEIMARETRLQSVIVPLGDGCWVGVKL